MGRPLKVSERLALRLERELEIPIDENPETCGPRGHWQKAGGVLSWTAISGGLEICSEDTMVECVNAAKLHKRIPPQTWWQQVHIDADPKATQPAPAPNASEE